ELARELGYRGAMKNLRTIHRIFLAVSSPVGVLERSPRLFQAYFSGGELRVVESRSGFARARITGCHGFDRNVWEAVIGTTEAALELARARDVRAELELEPSRPSEATVYARWS